MSRTGQFEYRVENSRGGVISIGEGQSTDFTPVELLLAALGGCNALSIEALTKRSEPELFDVSVDAQKTKSDDGGTQLEDIRIVFDIRFPSDDMGKKMTERLPDAVEKAHTKYCTVARTVEPGTPVAIRLTR